MAKNCLIYETLNGVKEMSVKKNGEFMTLSGVFGVCGVRNNNQRVYETSNYSKMVSEMQARIKEQGGIPGELEHPQQMNITLENISHKITDINIDEHGLVTGSITLLNTPKGKIAQAIVEGGLPLFISSRATGAVDSKTGNVTLEKISTYDLVGSPGFSQARLSLNENQIAESINESAVFYITEKENIEENNIEETDMELKEILEKLEALETRVEELQTENEELREIIESHEDIDLQALANKIQDWVIEQYSPQVQSWIEEHCIENAKEEILEEASEETHNVMKNTYAPIIQNWVTEQFGGEVEKWCINEFAPGIQNWVINEYTPDVEGWLNEAYSPKLKENMQEIVSESVKNNAKINLNAIDETLKLLENIEVSKPVYGNKNQTVINENNIQEPKYIREMPADVRVKWDMASTEVKESINRRAKLYNLVNEGAIQRFWEGINFEQVKPSNNIYEGLEAIENERERMIRAKIRAGRFNRM